jgi:CheY-like chemotaxis protein
MAGLLSGIRIILVEDHSDSREFLQECLRFEGAIVTGVSTAREAVSFVSQADVIVTDFLLSGADEDGAWLLDYVQRQSQAVRVIALSGLAAVQNARLAAAPFDLKLLKPVDPWILCSEILKVLHG